jgi:prolipoprotein diacylglyceryltransferase
LHVDFAHRPAGFEAIATYHPTFLYESLWNLALIGALLLVERHAHLRAGRLFALYVGGYGLGRLWVESLRIDHANRILGLRVNTWTSLAAIAVVIGIFLRDVRRRGTATAADHHELVS